MHPVKMSERPYHLFEKNNLGTLTIKRKNDIIKAPNKCEGGILL
jgi:hypothetical protein